LPIALGILAASEQIPARAGRIRICRRARCPAPCAPSAAHWPWPASRRYGGLCGLILPIDNADEAALVSAAAIYPASSLLQVCRHFTAHDSDLQLARHPAPPLRQLRRYPDFADVKGQQAVKRGLEVAAAGNHSVLLVGPPGAGKTMLAMRFPGLLPAMSDAEALEAAAVLSLTGQFRLDLWKQRPFRAPHHGIRCGPGRWRQPAAPRRNLAGPSRCALPRRAAN
jgi:magnesium chelatase family protein